jgi:hypothetical protein
MRKPSLTDGGVFVLATLTVFLLATWLGSPPAAWGAEPELEQEEVVPDTVLQKDDYPGPPAPEPRSRRPVREFFDKVKVNLQDADPFFRDTDLNLHLRTYYLGKWNTNDTTQQSWAGGGWLEYKSGWWKDTLQLGGTVFTTFPIYAPSGEGGTGLLTPDQDGFIVAGIAYGALRYKEYATVTGFRQFVDTPYVNRQDNRMVPRTNEAVTVAGKLGYVEYLAGYLWSQKPRDTSDFRSFSTIAGVPDKDRGDILGNLRITTPIEGLAFTVSNSYVPDLFNTFYVDGGYSLPLGKDFTLGLGAQYTDQRAVGQDLLTVSSFKEWVTYVASARLALAWKGLTLEGSVSRTGDGAAIQSPYGSYPGYISQLFNDFDRANELAWLVGLTYDFRGVGVPGFAANLEYSWGYNAIDAITRAALPNEQELDLSLAYTVQEGTFRGLRFDTKGGILDYTDSGKTGYQLRLILNYEFNLL